MLQKQPFVDDKTFWRPAVFLACYCVGKVYLEGRKPSDAPLNQPAWTAASRIRPTKGEGDTIGSISAAWRIPRWAVISHPAAMPESLWRGMHGRCVLPLGDRRLPW